MATKKPTTKAHRGFIHIRKDPGIGGRPRRRRPIGDPPPRGRRRPPRDPFNPFRPRRPRLPRFPFGRGRLGPADEPLGRRGRPTVEPQPIRRFPQMPIGRQPTPDERALTERQLRDLANRRRREPVRTPRMTSEQRRALSPSQRRLMQRQLRTMRRERRRGTPERDIGNILARQQRAADNFRRLRDIAFRRSISAQRRAKGGMIFKSKDYVNPSNTVDHKKK